MSPAVIAVLRARRKHSAGFDGDAESFRSGGGGSFRRMHTSRSFISRLKKKTHETRRTQVTPANLSPNSTSSPTFVDPTEEDFKARLLDDPDNVVGLTVREIIGAGKYEEEAKIISYENAKHKLLYVDGTETTDKDLYEGRWGVMVHENCWAQNWVRAQYESNFIQIAVAVLIFGNFIVSACEKVILPGEGSPEQGVFLVFEWFFGLIFTVELAWNMYGSWWGMFWASGWNWFDFIIVLISLLSLGLGNLPGISVLRLFRAFRVFRLFKRVPSLKLIIEGVGAALPGVSNAFVVLGILMGIWSIMGVEFFGTIRGEFSMNSAGVKNCEILGHSGLDEPEFGLCKFKTQEFGDFFKAMFSMWQIMTMDSWASGIARPLIYNEGHWITGPIFFISYTFIAGIIMTNVVVAILLEKYLECTSKAAAAKENEKVKKQVNNPKMRGANKAKSEYARASTVSKMDTNVVKMLHEMQKLTRQVTLMQQEIKEMKRGTVVLDA